MEKQKVCIIGGGLTGLITALVLSKSNLKIDLITGNINQSYESNRTTAISHENCNFLKKLRIFKFLQKEFWPCSQMKLYSEIEPGKFSEIFEIKKNKQNMKQILYMMNNSKIIKYLVKKIKKEKSIKFKAKDKISDIFDAGLLKSVKFKNKNKSRYNLIIVCSGKNSNLSKKYFNNGVFEHSYKETSITTVLEHNFLQNIVARQIFLDNGILAILPISNTKTSIVWSIKKNFVSHDKIKNDLFIKKKILFYTKKFLKKIKFISKLEYRDLNLVIRKNYYQNRVLLFGDALHVVHPLVGQGFNMVLRDLESLKKILESKINLGLDIGSLDVLSEFSKETKSRNFLYSIGIDFIKNFFSYQNEYFKKFRDKMITAINKEKNVKNIFFNFADKGFKF